MRYRHRLQLARAEVRCGEAWDRMDGDDRVRFCAVCRKHVYSTRERSFQEIKPILELYEGLGAVPFAVREDGTLVSTDGPSCAEARRARRRALASRVILRGGAAIAVAVAFVALGLLASPVTPPGEKRGAIPPLVEVIGPYIRHPDHFQTRVRARFVTTRSPSGAERSRPPNSRALTQRSEATD
jgi:hypothetical protein